MKHTRSGTSMLHNATILVALLTTHAIGGAVALSQENGNGQHSQMHAVPTPGKVVIDGSLDDWDRSGELKTYVMATTADQQFGKLAVMYDPEALYLGGEFRKAIPMMNRHSPEANGDRAWDADSLQFRLSLDPSLPYPLPRTPDSNQIVHLLLWNYFDRDEACLQAHRGMQSGMLPDAEKFGVIPKSLYQAAYRKHSDACGSTFEYRIPWKILDARRIPQGGNGVAATYQFNFGRADGLALLGPAGWAYDLKRSSGFAYGDASCWGRLLFSKSGNLRPQDREGGVSAAEALPCTFEYDLPESGEVSLAIYGATNEIVRVLAASAPRQAGRVVEHWDGLDELGQPLPAGRYAWKGLVHQPITTRYVMSVHNSGRPAYKSDDNTGGWGGDHGNPTAVCAVGDDLLLAWDVNEGGSGLICTDIDGRKKWGIINAQLALATDGTRVFAETQEFGKGLRCYDVKDGRPLTWGNGASVLQVPPGGDAKANVVSALAFQAGKLYVGFEPRDLVAVYDAAQGDLLTTYTVPRPKALAARPDGTLAAVSEDRLIQIKDGHVTSLADDHLDHPSGIAIAPDGTIYVANQGDMQNVSVFSPDGTYRKSIGKLGGRPWVGRFDPTGMLHPRGLAIDAEGRLWVMEAVDAPKRVSVWNVGTGALAREFFGAAHYSSFIWMDPERPEEVYCDGVIWNIDWQNDTATPHCTCWRASRSNVACAFSTHNGGFRPFTATNGRQYGLDSSALTVFRRDGDIFRPFLAVKGPASIWVDQNDDQSIQPDEIVATGDGKVQRISYLDSDLVLWGLGQRFVPKRVEKNGRPVYDFTAPEPVARFRPLAEDPEDGSLYALDNGYDVTGCLEGFDYGRFTADGSVRWGYRGRVSWPNGLQLPPQRSGKIWGPNQLLGTAGDFTGFASYYGCHHIYTRRDGLPVAMLFRDPRVAIGKLGADIIASENYNGQLVQPRGMNRYFALGGDQDGRISEVLGLETVRPLAGGSYVLSETDVRQAAAARRDRDARPEQAKKPVIVRGFQALDSAPAAEKTMTSGQSFKARLAYDSDNLSVRYEVTSPAGLVNAATDPQTIFKGGNLLDIQLATSPDADATRTIPAPGDVRVLISRRDGHPFAVIYRPKVRNFNGKPVVLSSPTGTESFDAIETSGKIGLDYAPRDGGFTATATIPLGALGWAPHPGSTVRLDVGYVFGNETGVKATGRAYWKNTGFAAGVLNDIPNESRLTPGEWGEMEVE